ncbi:MAG: CRISPR-associated protein Csx11 [Candidatus Abyssobacteria bacterium SURF_17]|uniref:CRISPR-associated protein Csx11 n=1 Tax=Candidatus Abyssobacteria bacterium SURF_17 TaxID=2093361 RepID=A0A419F3D3_9BACT|nr:MAG: CRISPR-associated protein Csx11 [Candidatus Abyssubacteria bacterium SURF_17]
MNDLAQKLTNARSFILWSEFAALIHDIGKLSYAFYKYRKEWHTRPKGYTQDDPHSDKFLEKHDSIIQKYPLLLKLFSVPVKRTNLIEIYNKELGFPDSDDFSALTAIQTHTTPKGVLMKMLKAADVVDSAEDRNNPLFSAEQTDRLKRTGPFDDVVYRTNVFGPETCDDLVPVHEMESLRNGLYEEFSGLLPSICRTNSVGPCEVNIRFESSLQTQLRRTIKRVFRKGLSDTTRPQNDTTLWEHSYAVASLFKIILAHWIIHKEQLDDYKKVTFDIFGVGWDGYRFISQGHKITDITGRKGLIEKIKESIAEIIEYTYPIGNRIYEDDNGIYFIVPCLPNKLLSFLKESISQVCAKTSDGELSPHFSHVPRTRFITQIIRALRDVRIVRAAPSGETTSYCRQKLEEFWVSAQESLICPVCQKRPMKKERVACNTCIDRRGGFSRKAVEEGQTPFIEEIADKNGQVALIVGKFGLDKWLSGEMVRTLMVTDARGLENEIKDLGNSAEFREEELKNRETIEKRTNNLYEYDYKRVLDDIGLCMRESYKDDPDEYASSILALYARRISGHALNRDLKRAREDWERFGCSGVIEHGKDLSPYFSNKEEFIANLVCCKTPTPSTILDVWHSTQEFLRDLCNSDGGTKIPRLAPWLEEERLRVRLRPTLVPSEMANEFEVWEGDSEPLLSSVEVYRSDDKIYIIGSRAVQEKTQDLTSGTKLTFRLKKREWEHGGAPIEVDAEIEGHDYFRPFREITSTPDAFMVLVPADKAIEVTQKIYARHVERFGKCIGRFPFSLGNIFFPKKTPMFVILDAARRMISNFQELSDHEETWEIVTRADGLPNSFMTAAREPVKWGNVNVSLGAGKSVDYHHPYLRVASGQNLSDRKSYFKTVCGEIVHFQDLEKGDFIVVTPNYYDFEFIDATSRRFGLHLQPVGCTLKRKHLSFKDSLTRPMYAERLQELSSIWNLLKHDYGNTGKVSDTKLHAIRTLLIEKYHTWNRDGGGNEWEEFSRIVLKKELGIDDSDSNLKVLHRAVCDKTFFESLELYYTIMKERVSVSV